MEKLFENNVAWSEAIKQQDPTFFQELAKQQKPEYLWIGCADSRIPANQIVGLKPGEVFVHRNIANMVVHTDLNCLSVMQFAIQYLEVKQVIVCGHYGCGGVQAAIQNQKLGLIDHWLRNIKDVQQVHNMYLSDSRDESETFDKICELNVVEQVVNVAKTNIVQDAWDRGQELKVDGLIYSISEGLLKNLDISLSCESDIPRVYEKAISQIKDNQ